MNKFLDKFAHFSYNKPMKLLYENQLIKLYLGDNSNFEINKDYALVTDPPYGINKKWKRKWHGNNGQTKLWDGQIPIWDEKAPVENVLKWTNQSKESVVWGGNFFPFIPSRCWFIWDKLQPNRGSEFEMAWTNLDCAPRSFRMSRIDAYFNKAIFKKVHPAEKPIQLMEWCLEKVDKDLIVFDPYAGCGATLLASQKLGRKAIGIEVNEEYCSETIKRLESYK